MSSRPFRLAWVGLGAFGLPIALNFVRQGWLVTHVEVQGRGRSGAAALLEAGGHAAVTVPGDADALVLCLPRDNDIDGVLAVIGEAAPGLIVDLSTCAPSQSAARQARLARCGRTYVDAPVSGSRQQAEAGELLVFCGRGDLQPRGLREILHTVGREVVLLGRPGAGAEVKLMNQMMHLAIMAVIGDVFGAMLRAGLAPDVALAAVAKGSGGSRMLDRFGELIVARSHPPQFSLTNAFKDVELASEFLAERGYRSALWRDVADAYQATMTRRGGGENFSVVCEHFAEGGAAAVAG